ncbi:hypothetical protein ES705_36168 [subsurface metagenome]
MIWIILKFTFRNFLRNKFYHFISISGLAIAIACAFLIMIWINYEFSFDRFHPYAKLNLIGCLDKPSSGEVFVNGTAVNTFSNKEAAQFRGQYLGFILQNFNLLPVLTTYENMEYPLIMVQNIKANECKKKIMRYLDAVGLADQKDKYPSQLSGGQK